jgi:hypothetical protein
MMRPSGIWIDALRAVPVSDLQPHLPRSTPIKGQSLAVQRSGWMLLYAGSLTIPSTAR